MGKLKGIDFNTIYEYNTIIDLLRTLIQLNSPYRTAMYIHTIDSFETIIDNFINSDYHGYPNQNDIKKFKNKCRKMLQYLKSQLP